VTENLSSDQTAVLGQRYEDLERGPLVQLAVENSIRGNLPSAEIIKELRIKDAQESAGSEGDAGSDATDQTTSTTEEAPEEAPQGPPSPPEMKNERPPAKPDPSRPIAQPDSRDAEPPEVLPVLTVKKFDEFTSFIEKRFGAEGRKYALMVNAMRHVVREFERQSKENADNENSD